MMLLLSRWAFYLACSHLSSAALSLVSEMLFASSSFSSSSSLNNFNDFIKGRRGQKEEMKIKSSCCPFFCPLTSAPEGTPPSRPTARQWYWYPHIFCSAMHIPWQAGRILIPTDKKAMRDRKRMFYFETEKWSRLLMLFSSRHVEAKRKIKSMEKVFLICFKSMVST